ncbi:MAG: hypothetical protein SFV15_15745 [Polyangiaceae bacterium]|nr:hypothetical protein [Polyangiaceae bacterium]
MSVEIKRTGVGGKLDDFLSVVDYIYRDDPNFVRPLDMDLSQRLGKKNPFFEHADAVFFTACRNGRPVGRASAQIDRLHLERYQDSVGFFGFLDTVNDQEVANELLAAAEGWLRARGIKRMRGPMSLSINEEIGCLIDGFDTPPMILMPHHLPYQGGLIEKAGFTKLKDLYAWRYSVGDVPTRAKKAHAEIAALPEVTSRHVDKEHIERDVGIVMDVFNDAWSDNWGFIPYTRNELRKMAEDFKLLLVPELTNICYVDGEPAAVAVALPNLNEIIADFRGKLFPFGLPKLLWRLKVERPKTARLAILGIRKKYRNVRKYAGLSTYMYTELNNAGAGAGVKWGELSWTLEDNGPVNVAIKLMGGKIYKTYRIYEKEL